MIKAVDVWEIMCITLIFAGMLEFAIMHAMLMRRKEVQKAKDLERKLKREAHDTDREDMVGDCYMSHIIVFTYDYISFGVSYD